MVKNGFIYLSTTESLTIDLTLDFHIHELQANDAVAEDAGKVALQRGPLVYCIEQADNPQNLWHYQLLSDDQTTYRFQPDLLNGIGTLSATAVVRKTTSQAALYQNYQPTVWQPTTLTFIPYYAWANRTDGQMRVWINKANA